MYHRNGVFSEYGLYYKHKEQAKPLVKNLEKKTVDLVYRLATWKTKKEFLGCKKRVEYKTEKGRKD